MLCVLAIYLATRRRDIGDILAGILLGIATILKPQLAGALLLFYLFQPRHRIWIVGVGLFALANFIGVARLAMARVHWLATFQATLGSIGGPGGFNDASLANAVRWQLINLQVPLFDLLSTRWQVNLLAWLIVAMLCLLFLLVWKRAAHPAGDALAAAVPLILSLLPVYHRYYDALILVLPLGWAIANLATRRNVHAIAVLICTVPFYVSSAFALDALQRHHYVPGILLHSIIWSLILMPMQTWLLIAMALVLMHCMWVNTPDVADAA